MIQLRRSEPNLRRSSTRLLNFWRQFADLRAKQLPESRDALFASNETLSKHWNRASKQGEKTRKESNKKRKIFWRFLSSRLSFALHSRTGNWNIKHNRIDSFCTSKSAALKVSKSSQQTNKQSARETQQQIANKRRTQRSANFEFWVRIRVWDLQFAVRILNARKQSSKVRFDCCFCCDLIVECFCVLQFEFCWKFGIEVCAKSRKLWRSFIERSSLLELN